MSRARGAALAELPATLGPAVKLGRPARAFTVRMARWAVYRWVPVFRECPHCGALVASKAAAARHRRREALTELALLQLGLLEPGPDIHIRNQTVNDDL